MTVQKMTNDLIDYRLGVIDEAEVYRRSKGWDVKEADAKFCVEAALAAGRVK